MIESIDWSNASHVLQAIFWLVVFGAAAHGYQVGARHV